MHTILMVGGIITTFLILIWGEKIPNFVVIIQFWTVLTVYNVLVIQFNKEKNKRIKGLELTINKIALLLDYIYKNRESKGGGVADTICSHIFNLKNWNTDALMKLSCEIYNPLCSNIHIMGKYDVGVDGIKKLISTGNGKDITDNKDEIDKIIKELKEFSFI